MSKSRACAGDRAVRWWWSVPWPFLRAATTVAAADIANGSNTSASAARPSSRIPSPSASLPSGFRLARDLSL